MTFTDFAQLSDAKLTKVSSLSQQRIQIEVTLVMLNIKSALLATCALIAAGQQTCPNSLWTYDAVAATCFLIGRTGVQTFNNAQFYCQQQGGNLAIVHTNIVESVLESLAQGADPDFYYYIGLRVNGDGQFVWIDGSALDIFKWCPNNPTTVSANICGALDAKSNCWRNVNCNTYLPFICTNDPSKATTTRPMTTTPPVACQPDNYPPGRGTVYSPGYPGNYGNNEDCNYLLTASPSNGQIFLELDAFNTEQCCDFLFIYDGPTRFSPLIQRVSGMIISPPTFYSTGQFMTLRFLTDQDTVSSGFSGRYSTVFRSTTTSRPTAGK